MLATTSEYPHGRKVLLCAVVSNADHDVAQRTLFFGNQNILCMAKEKDCSKDSKSNGAD